MLSIEQKRQIFIKLRNENYKASLRLEGLLPPDVPVSQKKITPTLAELIAKHGR
jgi:hypothetical protein